jgi:predicted DNA-binding transcriptional regulator AlpA
MRIAMTNAPHDAANRMLPLRDAAHLAGLSAGWMRHLIDTGRGPAASRIGSRLIKVGQADLDSWITANAIKPTVE